MVFHNFHSVPPFLPRRECDSRFCCPRPSPGPLKKCIEYYVFDHFHTLGPLGVIWAFSDLHLGTHRRSLELHFAPWPPLVPPDLFLYPPWVLFSDSYTFLTNSDHLSKHIKNTWFFILLDRYPPKRYRVSAIRGFASRVPSRTPEKM